jgi:4-hydroxybenzoyl-CoA thioesterase
MFTHTRSILVEWGDCDPAGIVFYPRYFAWFDASTAGLFAAAGLPKPELIKRFDIVGFPMVDTSAKFHIPSSFGETIQIETTATAFRRSSFDIRHRVLKNGAVAVVATETRVWTGVDPENPKRLKSKPIPQEVIDLLTSGPKP